MKFRQIALVSTLTVGSFTAITLPKASEAQAADWIIEDKSSYDRPIELGILLGLPYCCGEFSLNPGVLVGIPIVKDGFVPINDSFYLEFGAWAHLPLDTFDDFGLTPVAGVRWNFHLMEVWDAYAAARLGVGITNVSYFHFNTAVGSTWKFSKSIGLRGELGGGSYGAGLSVGIDIDF